MKNTKTLILTIIILLGLAGPLSLQAGKKEILKDLNVYNDFELGPTSFEIEAEPGTVLTKSFFVTNREGKERTYKVEVEDFEGSLDDPTQTVLLKGDKTGKYGAKEWIVPEIREFRLKHGERQFVDFVLKVPETADAGDHYASILVSAVPENVDKNSNVRITSRVGALLFVRVRGEITEEGGLQNLWTRKDVYTGWPVDLNLTFKNTGTVRLQPHGKIVITNFLGKVVDNIPVKSFNSLRNSIRGISYDWERKNDFLIGRFTAIAYIDRGYGNFVDSETVTFWIFPKKELAIILILILVLFSSIIFLRNKARTR